MANEDEDPEKTYINKLVFMGKSTTMTYEYDFGDDWLHTVKIEKILPENEDVDYPGCVRMKMFLGILLYRLILITNKYLYTIYVYVIYG